MAPFRLCLGMPGSEKHPRLGTQTGEDVSEDVQQACQTNKFVRLHSAALGLSEGYPLNLVKVDRRTA